MGKAMQVVRKAPYVVALGVSIVMVGSLGVASAATGSHFILGQTNTESTTSVLRNTNGTPLSLVAPAGKAPLAVNRPVKVNNLNADRLDGRDSTYFQPRIGRLVWHPLALQNGWVQYGGTRVPSYAVGADGLVYFMGGLDGTGSTSTAFATLPASLRPATSTFVYLTADQCGATTGRIYFTSDGVMNVQDDWDHTASSTCWFTSLDGIVYTR